MRKLAQHIRPALSLALLLGLVSISQAVEPGEEIVLWPTGAAGSEGKTNAEVIRIAEGGDRVISGVHRPSITPYLPPANKARGCAVIVAPGGGHRELWSDHEGHNVARWLSDRGIAAFVLKYRLARETNSTYTVDDHALADMQRALRLVRSRCKDWGVATNHLGVMGFSAGGEVAFLAAQRLQQTVADTDDPVDRLSALPAFQALIYPGRLPRLEVTTNSPPAFLAGGYNDRPDISEGLATAYLKFKQAKVPAELHIYAGSGHGFGFRTTDTKPAAKWPERFEEWLADSGFLAKE